MPGSGGDRNVCVWAPSRVPGGGTISCGVLEPEPEPSPASDPDRMLCVVAGTNGKFNDEVAGDPSADGAGCGEDPKKSRGRSLSAELVELLR